MLGTFASIVGILVTALLSVAAAVAAAFGIAIVLVAGFGFLLLLVVFVVVSSLATRYRFEEKARRHVQEGHAGERGVSNVLAHIVLPTAVAMGAGFGWLSWPLAAVMFASALAFAASDTLASEFGVLMGSAVSILSFREVPAGTNGGVSVVGEMFAIAGSVGTALVGFALFGLFGEPVGLGRAFLLAVGIAGFLACQVDSVLGATLENRGLLTKGSTNFLGMLFAIALGPAVAVLAGAHL